MTVLFFDSFEDSLPLGKWDAATNATVVTGLHGNGITGGDVSNDSALTRALPNTTTAIISFNCNISTAAGVTALMSVRDASTIQWNVYYDAGLERLNVTTAAGTTIVSSSNGSVPLNVWFHMAFKVTTHTSTGAIEIKLDGVTDGTGSGDTQATANAYVNRVLFRGANDVDVWTVDDFVFQDTAGSAPYNDFLGPVRVDMLTPNGNGNSSVLVGSDADSTDNYLLVDDNPYSSTDYVGSATEGDKDTYALPAMATPDTVYGVQVNTFRAKSDAGAKFMRPVVRSNSVDYAGTSKALWETYTTDTEIWEQNPNTSTAWTKTTVDAAEVGAEVRDS